MHDNCLLNGKIRQRVCSNFGLSGHLVYGTLAKYLTLARAGRQHLQHFSICFVNRTRKKKNGLPATECLRKLCLPPVAGHNAKLSCVQIHFFAVSRTLLFHSFCQMQTKPITKSTQPGNQQNWAIRGTCKVWLANNCNLLSQEPSKAQTMSVSMWPA